MCIRDSSLSLSLALSLSLSFLFFSVLLTGTLETYFLKFFTVTSKCVKTPLTIMALIGNFRKRTDYVLNSYIVVSNNLCVEHVFQHTLGDSRRFAKNMHCL